MATSSKKIRTKAAATSPKPKEKKKEAKDKTLQGPTCVFALRMREEDRRRIHAAAGPAKASKFVFSATMAAVTGDTEAFKKVVASRATN